MRVISVGTSDSISENYTTLTSTSNFSKHAKYATEQIQFTGSNSVGTEYYPGLYIDLDKWIFPTIREEDINQIKESLDYDFSSKDDNKDDNQFKEIRILNTNKRKVKMK